MNELEGYELVETTVRTHARASGPEHYQLQHISTLLRNGEDDDDTSPRHAIGKLHWDRFALGAALAAGEADYEIFDSIDSDIEHLYHTIFDEEGEVRSPFVDVTVMDIIYIEEFELVDSTYDAQEVAEELVEHVLMFQAPDDVLVTFLRGPKDSDAFVAALEARGFDRILGEHRDRPPFYAVSLNERRPPLAPKP